MSKKNENKKELAFLLYMQGVTIGEIMERCGIGSNRTVNEWIKKGEWKEKRAAKTISRTELVNMTLKAIHDTLENSKAEDFPADKLSKLGALLEKLDKQESPVIIMDVFMGFGKFLHNKSQTDKEVDLDFLKKLNKYQDLYITDKLNG